MTIDDNPSIRSKVCVRCDYVEYTSSRKAQHWFIDRKGTGKPSLSFVRTIEHCSYQCMSRASGEFTNSGYEKIGDFKAHVFKRLYEYILSRSIQYGKCVILNDKIIDISSFIFSINEYLKTNMEYDSYAYGREVYINGYTGSIQLI
jgi:hypothetical protein